MMMMMVMMMNSYLYLFGCATGYSPNF